MADKVCVWSKGRFVEWADLAKASAAGEALMVVLFKSSGIPTDAVLEDCKFLSDALTAGAVEADFTFTGSRRKVITGVDITVNVNTTTNVASFDLADLTWAAAGGATQNTLAKLGVFFRRVSSDGDTAIRCISFHDFAGTTTGQDLKAVIPLIASDT